MSEKLHKDVLSSGNTRLTQTAKKTAQGAEVENIAEGSKLENNKQITNISLADRDFYFYMTFYSKDGQKIIDYSELKADELYIVRLSVSLNKAEIDNLKQNPIKIKRELDLSLESTDVEFQDLALFAFSPEEYGEWSKDILFKTRKGSKKIDLRLNYKEGKGGFISFASRLILDVDSKNTTIINPKILELTNISNPINAVILSIIPAANDDWLIQATSVNDCLDLNIKKPQGKINLRTLSKIELGALSKWLLNIVNETPNVIISDRTHEQINWELLQFHNDYLGVKANVSRWIKQEAWGEEIKLSLADIRVYSGSIASCSLPDDDIEKWQYEICANYQRGSVVTLISCPEELEDKEIDFSIASDFINNCSLFLWANIPKSACIYWDEEYPSGLAAKALSEMISGFVGSLNDVDHKFAKLITKEFIKRAEKEGGIRPVTFLRMIRSAYIKKLSEGDLESQRRVREMLPSVFSYVYYGSPYDVVKITGGEP